MFVVDGLLLLLLLFIGFFGKLCQSVKNVLSLCVTIIMIMDILL